MKQTRAKQANSPQQQVYQVLEDLHSYINERVFEPRQTRLPMPVFSISASMRASRFGSFNPGLWRHTEAETAKPSATGKEELRPDEINIDGQNGMARPFISVAATVFHEMSHQTQEHFPDVYGKPSKTSNYHNKGWHECCQISGLLTAGPKGETKVTDEFREFMADFPNPERWLRQRPSRMKDTAATRMKKYVCACETHITNTEENTVKDGPYVIRAAGTGLQATCDLCSQSFSEEDPD